MTNILIKLQDLISIVDNAKQLLTKASKLKTGDSVSWNSSGGRHINAYIDDLRITKGLARYTTNFTPPTTAFLAR